MTCQTLIVVGASNNLPEDDAVRVLFDRFLLRVNCENVSSEQLGNVLLAGWKLDQASRNGPPRRSPPVMFAGYNAWSLRST